MKKFAVHYSGFAYVEAESEEEAKEKYFDDDTIYDERDVTEVHEVEEFTISI